MKRLNFLSKDDYYEVKFGSMLASYDRDILTMLYQPIIGYAGLALYFTLWSEAKRNDYSSLIKHEILIFLSLLYSELLSFPSIEKFHNHMFLQLMILHPINLY